MNSRLAKSIVAVVAAPSIAGFVMGLISSWFPCLIGVGSEARHTVMAAALLAVIAFGVPFTLIIGLPVHALLLAMRWTR